MTKKYYNKILELVEDDYYNLYEVFWYVKEYGNFKKSEGLEITRSNVEKLYNDKLVNIFEREGLDGQIKPILNDDKVKKLINSNISWEVPKSTDTHIILTISSAGEKYRIENFNYND